MMKNIKQLFAALVVTMFWASATAQTKPANDTVAIGASVTGADATGPTAINTAHGKPLDTTGVIIHKKVTYTYFKKPITDQAKTASNDSGAVDTSNQTTTANTSHQSATASVDKAETHHCCCWGWLGLLGLL